MAAAPASSTIFATSTALMVLSLIPARIFTVTGRLMAVTSLLTKLPMASGCLSKALPAPVLMTFHAGHPQLISMMSNFFSRCCAAWIMSCMLFPKSCTATGCSSVLVWSMVAAFLLPRTMLVLLTNSV